MVRWVRIYVSQRAKYILEQYGMHNGYNFNNIIWELINHQRYCTNFMHCKCRKEITRGILGDLSQPNLDGFGRIASNALQAPQDSSKVENGLND